MVVSNLPLSNHIQLLSESGDKLECNISNRDLDLCFIGEGTNLFGGAYARFITLHEINNVKYICFSDDDDTFCSTDISDYERVSKNLNKALNWHSRVRGIEGVYFTSHIGRTVKSKPSCYYLDAYFPFSWFDKIKDSNQMACLLAKSDFSSKEAIFSVIDELVEG
ncbi:MULTISPECIES: hypothetical protein [Vibrio]|uniref:hypothetical protein n=1 Tax=Vibrio TaxID=662 RepID=UPI0008421B07|nr:MULTISPECIES: hypothetical protein [Vibrio]ODM56974.1 hypothetical protein BC455_17940 [Vibrio harveyi]USD58681.1 hypothetical protein J4N44_27395 [Vibrio sp. SCSIO 43155]